MSTKGVLVVATALLLYWCQDPTMSALAAKAGARGSRNIRARLLARVNDLQHCKNRTHSYVVKNTTNRLEKDGTEYLDTDFDLKSNARQLTAFRLIFHRCPLGVGGECEYFNTWSWNMPVCALLKASKMLWTPVIQSIRPRWACPISKGSYASRNLTLDVAALGKAIEGLNVDKYSWPVEVQLDSEKGLYICFSAVVHCRNVRVKEN